MVFHGEYIVRLFNPVTMTEVLAGIHDTTGAIQLPDDNWFFTIDQIPEGKRLAVSESGEPILIDVTVTEQ